MEMKRDYIKYEVHLIEIHLWPIKKLFRNNNLIVSLPDLFTEFFWLLFEEFVRSVLYFRPKIWKC